MWETTFIPMELQKALSTANIDGHMLIRWERQLPRSNRTPSLESPPRRQAWFLVLGLFIASVMLWLVRCRSIWVSSCPDFQASYPQAKSATHRDVIPWGIVVLYHGVYFLVFLSGESFWRGYMTFGLGRELGLNAVPWMVMVYSIANYGKPWLEVNGAIVAGFVLGFLAFRPHSFWLGVLLHWSIALAIDLAVIARARVSLDWASGPW